MSLFVVFANATSGSVAYARQRWIDYRSGIWFAVATLPGAVAGAILVGYMPRRLFDAIFAALLLSLAAWLVIRRPTQAIQGPITGRGVVQRDIRDRDGIRYFYAFQLWKGIVISTAVGFVSSLLGIGGGIIHVPIMATVLHFPVHLAAATSHFVLAFMAGEGTIVHLATGALAWDRALSQAVLLAVGAVPGAQIGARLARRVRGPIILRALGAALALLGARLLLKAVLE